MHHIFTHTCSGIAQSSVIAIWLSINNWYSWNGKHVPDRFAHHYASEWIRHSPCHARLTSNNKNHHEMWDEKQKNCSVLLLYPNCVRWCLHIELKGTTPDIGKQISAWVTYTSSEQRMHLHVLSPFFFYISTVARHIDWVDYMTLECEIHHECQCCGTYIHTLFDSNCMTTTSARLSIVNRTKRSISVMFLLLLLSLQFSQQQKKASVSGRENLIERRFNRIESRLKFHSASVRARIRFGRFHTI